MKNITIDKKIGIAVDLGTSEINLHFYDLKTKKSVYKKKVENAQNPYGKDLNSRLKYHSMEPDKNLLNEILINQINKETDEFLIKNKLSDECIERIVIAGNTIMEHFAAGVELDNSDNGFTALTLFGIEDRAIDLGLKTARNAIVYFAPCVSEYVGGDFVSGMIYNSVDKAAKNILYIDIGANVELAMKVNNKIYCSSCDKCSILSEKYTPLKEGLITEVFADNGKIGFNTIGNINPVSISLSGVIDAVASAIELGLIDNKGKIKNSDRIYISDEFFLTQKDIREIQLVKSSIAAAIVTIVENAGITISEVEEVIISGMLNINITSAIKIGLIPVQLLNCIKSVGNSAVNGAIQILLNSEEQDRAQYLADKCQYIKLSETPFFGGEYVSQMMF